MQKTTLVCVSSGRVYFGEIFRLPLGGEAGKMIIIP